MSRNSKIILAIVAGALVLLGVCACVGVLAATLVYRTAYVNVSSSRAETIGEKAVQAPPALEEAAGDPIAEITLPRGWVHDYSIRVAGFRLTGYKPESGAGHIILAVLPEMPGTDIEELERELAALTRANGYTWNQHDMRVVERKGVTVMGQSTEMVISEGEGSSGSWRQAMVSFRGQHGLTLVTYGMPQDAYNQAEADALFASIR